MCIIEMFSKQATAQAGYEPWWKFLPVFSFLWEFSLSQSTLISFLSCNWTIPETISICYLSH